MAENTAETRENRYNTACGTNTAEIAADWYSGGAKALAEGLKAYAAEIDSDNIYQMGLGNGIVEGVLSGISAFAEEFAKTTRRVVEDSREIRTRRAERQQKTAPGPAIDYEKLAHLVSLEMQKAAAKKSG